MDKLHLLIFESATYIDTIVTQFTLPLTMIVFFRFSFPARISVETASEFSYVDAIRTCTYILARLKSLNALKNVGLPYCNEISPYIKFKYIL